MVTKILWIDDHPSIRNGIAIVLPLHDAALEIISQSSIADARACLEAAPGIDLILLDVQPSVENGLIALPSLREDFPAVPMILMSGAQKFDRSKALILDGAQGFLSKRESVETIVEAIQIVLDGGMFIAVNFLVPCGPLRVEQCCTKGSPLSDRKNAVLQRMVLGQSNKVIAAELHLSPNTVRDYVSDIMRELDADSRTEAVSQAIKRGWVTFID
ncbi:MAG: DNA-binding NarL/FixJ family response regulator [Gammaproteobacteria bacterium]|jgi:DNA-binding NarL/FixJ family response regulator